MSWVFPQLGGLELDSSKGRDAKILDHYTFLGKVLGRGRWAVSQYFLQLVVFKIHECSNI